MDWRFQSDWSKQIISNFYEYLRFLLLSRRDFLEVLTTKPTWRKSIRVSWIDLILTNKIFSDVIELRVFEYLSLIKTVLKNQCMYGNPKKNFQKKISNPSLFCLWWKTLTKNSNWPTFGQKVKRSYSSLLVIQSGTYSTLPLILSDSHSPCFLFNKLLQISVG